MTDLTTSPPRPARIASVLADLFLRGWRPAAGWACGVTIVVRGAVVPIIELLRGREAGQFDWVSVTALVGVLGLGAFRTIEKARETANG